MEFAAAADCTRGAESVRGFIVYHCLPVMSQLRTTLHALLAFSR
jgi:hypothetical protein